MHNSILQDALVLGKIIGWLAGLIGSFMVIIISLVSFIYIGDRKQNWREHNKLFTKTDDHSERISTIEGANKK